MNNPNVLLLKTNYFLYSCRERSSDDSAVSDSESTISSRSSAPPQSPLPPTHAHSQPPVTYLHHPSSASSSQGTQPSPPPPHHFPGTLTPYSLITNSDSPLLAITSDGGPSLIAAASRVSADCQPVSVITQTHLFSSAKVRPQSSFSNSSSTCDSSHSASSSSDHTRTRGSESARVPCGGVGQLVPFHPSSNGMYPTSGEALLASNICEF